MTHDLVLRLRPGFFGWLRVELEKPPELGSVKGRLTKPPPAWSPVLRYFAGEPDVDALRNWLHASLGGEMVRAISSFVTVPARLFVTSSGDMPELLVTPWEVLEESREDMQVGEQLSVIRSFDCGTQETPPEKIPVALRLLVTFANPDGDIPDLDEHLADLEALAKTTDDAIAVNVVEFTDYDSVQSAGAAFVPNVVYHVGHAEQPAAGAKVSLRVGPSGERSYLNGGQYAQLVRSFSPNLLVLNACSAISGYDMNPYLGIAREALTAAPSVVCMQTKVPAGAARRFGDALFRDLAGGVQLSRAMRNARLAMIRGHPTGTGGFPLFTRFIPVQLACGWNDPQFIVAEGELSRRRLRNRLKSYLETSRRLLRRSFEQPVADLLSKGSGVAVITGPKASGKSTTVRECLRAAIESADTSRHLYYRVKGQLPETKWALRQILNEMTGEAQFGWLMHPLRERIAEKRQPDSHRELSELATYMAEEGMAGRRYVVVLDDLPSELAMHVANIAANVIDHGLLLLVTSDVPPALGISHLAFSYMTENEITHATAEVQAAKDVLARTGGVPYLVVAALDRQPLDPAFLGSYLEALPDSTLHAVRLAARARTPLPRTWLAMPGTAAAVLNETVEGLAIVEFVRDAVNEYCFNDTAALHAELHDLFVSGSETQVRGAVERERVRLWKKEAVDQALELAKLYQPIDPQKAQECLQNTLILCLDLHHEHMIDTGDVVSAKALWEQYRAVSLDFDREAETAYGEALAETGELNHADRILEAVTGTGGRDDVHVSALLLRSDIVKRMGKPGAFELRLQLLNEARDAVLELLEHEPKDKSLQELHGDVEQSLGNLLAFGRHVRVKEAEAHLREAFRIFDSLGDLRAYRASAEIVEMRRYNDLMTDPERTEAIATITSQLDQLALRSMREDAVRHSYELGRLEREPLQRAKWFRKAFETAGESYAPLNWNAALQWKLAEIDAGQDADAEALAYAKKLAKWPENVWSQRLRRRALRVLAECATQRGEAARAAGLLRNAWAIVESLYQNGEERGDRADRLAIARAIDHLRRGGVEVLADHALLGDSLREETAS